MAKFFKFLDSAEDRFLDFAVRFLLLFIGVVMSAAFVLLFAGLTFAQEADSANPIDTSPIVAFQSLTLVGVGEGSYLLIVKDGSAILTRTILITVGGTIPTSPDPPTPPDPENPTDPNPTDPLALKIQELISKAPQVSKERKTVAKLIKITAEFEIDNPKMLRIGLKTIFKALISATENSPSPISPEWVTWKEEFDALDSSAVDGNSLKSIWLRVAKGLSK